MTHHTIELRTKRYVKGCGLLSFGRNIANKYGRKLLDTATKTGMKALKTATKKVAHKAAKTRGKLIGNKIANKIEKPKPVPDESSRNGEEIIIPLEPREEILNELRQVL